MSIKCLAQDYVIKENDDVYYVYNQMYEETLGKIMIALIIGLLIPEASDYYLPICIKIRKTKEDIIVRENLEVIGNTDFEYFVAKHQYKKWNKIFRGTKNIILMLSMLINIFLIYLFWKLKFNLVVGLCMVFMLFISIGAIVKLEWNNKKRMKYEMIDIVF